MSMHILLANGTSNPTHPLAGRRQDGSRHQFLIPLLLRQFGVSYSSLPILVPTSLLGSPTLRPFAILANSHRLQFGSVPASYRHVSNMSVPSILSPDPFWPIGPFDSRFFAAACLATFYVYYTTGFSFGLLVTVTAVVVFAIMSVISA